MNKSAISDRDASEYVKRYSEPGRLHAGFELYRAFPRDIRQNKDIYFKEVLPMPVLALGGQRGVGPVVKEQLLGKASTLEGGIIDSVGHFIPEEAPDGLATLIDSFLARNPAALK